MSARTDMTGKTVVITGGNSGIGKASAVALASAGARVLITARHAGRGAAAVADIRARSGNDDVDVALFDLSSIASTRSGAAEVLERCPRVDVLVNNAGVVLSGRRQTDEGVEVTFATNVLGPYLLTTLLLDRIVAASPARIVNVSSALYRMAGGLNFDDLQSRRSYHGMRVYARTKLADIYLTVELARRLAGTGVTANCVHPGALTTGFGADGDTNGLIAAGLRLIRPLQPGPGQGAMQVVMLASSPSLAQTTGEYFAAGRRRRPAGAARDAAAARRLWDACERLVSSD